MSSVDPRPSFRKFRSLRVARPLQRHRELSIVTCTVLFLAFLLFLLVALSLPIIRPIYLVGFNAGTSPSQPETSVATELRFGVWGYCATSELDPPTWYSNDGSCSGPRLGYNISDSILALTGYETVAKDALTALTYLLVLHPIVAGLSFIGMFTSLWIASHTTLIISLIITTANVILSATVFGIDLAIVIVARYEVSKLTQYNFSISFGNAVWIILVAVIFSWVGLILLSIPVCGCCGVGRRYNDWESYRSIKAQDLKTKERSDA